MSSFDSSFSRSFLLFFGKSFLFESQGFDPSFSSFFFAIFLKTSQSRVYIMAVHKIVPLLVTLHCRGSRSQTTLELCYFYSQHKKWRSQNFTKNAFSLSPLRSHKSRQFNWTACLLFGSYIFRDFAPVPLVRVNAVSINSILHNEKYSSSGGFQYSNYVNQYVHMSHLQTHQHNFEIQPFGLVYPILTTIF